jgi:hypothetical protein
LPAEDVLVIADPRDPIAREWIKTFAKVDDAEVDRMSVPFEFVFPKMDPVYRMVVTRQGAIDALATNNPTLSERLEQTPVEVGRAVLCIASKGTSMIVVPNDEA